MGGQGGGMIDGWSVARALTDPASVARLDAAGWTRLLSAARALSLIGTLAEIMTDQPLPLLNTLPVAVRRLGLGRSKVYEEIAAGNLRVVKVGRRTLIAETELQRYVRNLTEAAV